MRIYIDDGSTNIKMLWEQDQEGEVIKISPNSFKRGWGTAFGTGKPFNYTVDNEKYSFDIIDPDNLPTNNVAWQYSPLNAVAVQHALQISGLPPKRLKSLSLYHWQNFTIRMRNIEWITSNAKR